MLRHKKRSQFVIRKIEKPAEIKNSARIVRQSCRTVAREFGLTNLKEWYGGLGFIQTGTKEFDHLPFTVGFMEKDTQSI